MTFATASNDWIKLVGKNWMYIRFPKLGVVKVRIHRAIPDGFTIQQASLTRKLVMGHGSLVMGHGSWVIGHW